MTYSTLAAIVKYPFGSLNASENGKFGFFTTEEEIYRRVAAELGIIELCPGRFARHPLTIIMEAADDICYQIMDIEDSHRLKILSGDEVRDLFLAYFTEQDRGRMQRAMDRLDDPNEKVSYMRSKVIGALVDACAKAFAEHEDKILQGLMTAPLLSLVESRLRDAYEACSATAWDKIYRAAEVVDIEIAGNRIITSLMEAFTEAVLHPERNASRLLLSKVPRQYAVNSPTLFGRLQAVLDHISGMTDVYALDLFRRLNGHTLPAV